MITLVAHHLLNISLPILLVSIMFQTQPTFHLATLPDDLPGVANFFSQAGFDICEASHGPSNQETP